MVGFNVLRNACFGSLLLEVLPKFPNCCLAMLSTWLSFAASCQAIVVQQRQIPAPTPSPQLNKTGLAWGGGDADITQYESSKVSWYYTWGPNDWVQGENNLEYVPMFWGAKNADTFRTYVNESTIASNGIKHVLGMNEPEQTGQSNLSAADAVQWWQTYMEPLRQYNVSLGSPAMSAATRSKQWLIDFATACEPHGGCNYDFLALHWYGVNTTKFTTYLEDMHATFPEKPIWLTEFACHNFQEGGPQCTYADTVAFMNTTQAWLDQQDWVHRYAWFGAMKEPVINTVNALMDSSGLINDLGKQYIGEMAAPANPTQPTPSGAVVKINAGYIASTPASAASLLVGAIVGVVLIFA
ncbi:glycosyl hydrolase catalytic core-domain-containing protein [Rhizoctonia solani]|nr:glycosyl hydrolase catalytic core-domain-containing protein [Rhizoctonia solani]